MGLKKHKKGSEWVDWLKDEPLPARPAHQQAPAEPVVHHTVSSRDHMARDRLRRAGLGAQQQPSQPTTKTGNTPAVSININLPKVKLPKIKLPSRKQFSYWGTFGVVLITLSIGSRLLLGLAVKPNKGASPAVKGASTASTQPTFSPAVPSNKKDLAKPDGKKSKYVASKHLYTYTDTLLDSLVTVSEQSVPETFKKDPNSLKNVAASIGAATSFQTAFGAVYVATSDNKTSQRLVFVHQDLLIFIESVKTYDNDAWKLYIENLRS